MYKQPVFQAVYKVFRNHDLETDTIDDLKNNLKKKFDEITLMIYATTYKIRYYKRFRIHNFETDTFAMSKTTMNLRLIIFDFLKNNHYSDVQLRCNAYYISTI